jgi:hypothetical protein
MRINLLRTEDEQRENIFLRIATRYQKDNWVFER